MVLDVPSITIQGNIIVNVQASQRMKLVQLKNWESENRKASSFSLPLSGNLTRL